ncbi:DNA-repair protein XRCC1-like [Bidens hawaiensis]|uniref:DNA-repair protein XRCC1-like n=1 Tax=Bidens hawaiensis TaxID=980011 RepID=UPI00404BA373
MPDSGSHKATGRALPSWMSSRDVDKNSDRNEQVNNNHKDKRPADQTANKFSKLMDGVVFVLSGFVNPERSTLRSQALEMGAQYQGDWNANCTLLVCAFVNTPKFRQVEADNGTVVSKGWITECYEQKQLVAIEPFLLHAGKPWRHQSSSTGPSQDPKQSSSKSSYKKADKSIDSKPQASTSSKSQQQTAHKPARKEFLTSEVKKWAIDDMNKTMSWLNSQEEKPDSSEIKKIAAEGILTCLQDAIDSLKEGRGMGKILEEWSFVPRVVEELNKLDIAGDSVVKKDVYHQAIVCKRIYEFELGKSEDEKPTDKNKRAKVEKSGKTENYDSDDTIEMTEDEVKEAYGSVASSIHK